MKRLRLMVPLILCGMSVGCAESQAEKELTSGNESAKWTRGEYYSGYDFVLWPKERRKFVAEIKRIGPDTTASEVIAVLGKPDDDYILYEGSFGPAYARDLTYYFLVYRNDRDTEGTDQFVRLQFDRNNIFESYTTSGNIEELK